MFASNTSQVSSDATYIEDVFSTWLYTGNGSTQTINNGIDLAGKGGLVWCKTRGTDTNYSNLLFDTVRGATKVITSNTTDAESTFSTGLTAFNADGFSVGSGLTINKSGNTLASWTFRKQPKFFDVVTFNQSGASSGFQTVSHNLGSVPGCIIIKRISSTSQWYTYHRSTPNDYLILNSTAAATNTTLCQNLTSTTFDWNKGDFGQGDGTDYVAYLFAHDAGGFGLTGTDNVISCGSFTTDGSGNATVNLGYEPQWIMVKKITAGDEANSGHWWMQDNMRGYPVRSGNSPYLQANTSQGEVNPGFPVLTYPTSTGFVFNQNYSGFQNSNFIYIAIRRGPMRTPTSGTSVFAPVANTQSSGTVRTIGFPADLAISTGRTTNLQRMFNDRLRGFSQTNTSTGPRLFSNTTDAETTSYTGVGAVTNTGYQDGDYFDPGISMIRYLFGRAPGFFDEVCYTGTGSARTLNHNLGVKPEFMIAKARGASYAWVVYHKDLGATKYVFLNYDASVQTNNEGWYDTEPTATQFTVAPNNYTSANGIGYVWYGFASCPGVSKVGSYTGTGTTQQINCGFTGGARFVLIKRTDSTGDWYVWDSARGIVAGNDPYLLLNSTAAEVTGTDYVDTYTGGFEISSTAPAAINASGGSFIFLAIA